MDGLHWRRIPGIEDIIRNIDYFGSYTFANELGSFNFYADGMVGLIYHETDSDIFYNGKKGAQLFLYGQTIRPLSIAYTRSFSMLVFYFQPYALKSIFGIDANELTETCLDFDLVDDKLRVSLQEVGDTEIRINMICNYLIAAQKRIQKEMDKKIAYATDRIINKTGNISIASLRQEIFITERTFERQFLRSVGVTPGTFAKICRFNYAKMQLDNQAVRSLTDLAFTAGYADQSHFIHHFREFTSMTPTEYLLLVNGQFNPSAQAKDCPD